MMSAFSYNLTLTGDCSSNSSGAFILALSGGTPPYTIEFLAPLTNATIVNTISPIFVSSLSGGSYSVKINDSSTPTNLEYYINIPISSGFCANISNVVDTTCGNNNGQVVASTTSNNSSIYSYLYTQQSNLIDSKGSISNYIFYNNLSGGTYYLYFEDFGGCTAKTESFIIESFSDFDFGYYVIDDSPCFSGSTGKIYITGETGYSPYTYNWSVPQTGNTITGLTSGLYSVEIVDAKNCSKTKTIEVKDVQNLGIQSITTSPPICFNSNGSITITLSGGTAPYYYLLNGGYVDITYEKTILIDTLPANGYNISITDAGLCNINTSLTLSTVNSMISADIFVQNSYCSNNGGVLTLTANGGLGPYTFGVINSSGNTNTFITNSNNHTFNNLQSGDYTAYITDSSGCYYSDEVTIMTENRFSLNYSTTGTTCGNSNGGVFLYISSGGTPPYSYYLGTDYSILDTSLSAVTFNNIQSGQYTSRVIDSLGCEQTKEVYISQNNGVDFYLYPIPCDKGNDGIINTFITKGKPPFTFNWSSNIPNNPQSIVVSGLTGGTYTLLLTDDNECSLKREIIVDCFKSITTTQVYTIDTQDFIIQPIGSQTLADMFNEGFYDLTSNNPLCNLNYGIYEIIVELEPNGYSDSLIFYTGYTINSAPLDSEYADVLKSIISDVPGVESVEYDLFTNKVKIIAEPNNQQILSQVLTIRLKITYDIICTS
jgi:hypothetical protein